MPPFGGMGCLCWRVRSGILEELQCLFRNQGMTRACRVYAVPEKLRVGFAANGVARDPEAETGLGADETETLRKTEYRVRQTEQVQY